ncbi:PIN domain-containing protein [Planktothricoides raciborskii]|uniref:PIN domain-containing protein n=1 Tax=Planktothricoides raciborskii GIHE-MW2 TaxID=2792601 RepID=A0AAU8JIP3_9CYAN
MKVLLDTNVIVDVAVERQPYFAASQQVLLKVEQKEIEGYVSPSILSDIYYIVRKARGKDWTIDFLNWLVNVCQIATVNDEAIRVALSANFADFEDAIQYGTAVVNQLEVIVTRNPQDFPVETPRIMTPSELI